MLYSELADTFDRLEATGSRLEMTTILADFIKGVDKSELRNIIYLSQGKLHPDFISKELGMADRLVLKAISFTSGTPDSKAEELWIKTGDPGEVAEQLISKKKQMTLFAEGHEIVRNIPNVSSSQEPSSRTSLLRL